MTLCRVSIYFYFFFLFCANSYANLYIKVESPFNDQLDINEDTIKNSRLLKWSIGKEVNEYLDLSLGVSRANFSFFLEDSSQYDPLDYSQFAFAYTKPVSYCANIPSTFLSKNEICNGKVPHNKFAFAYTKPVSYCANIPSTFLSKNEICNAHYKALSSVIYYGTIKSTSIIPRISFKPFKKLETVQPFIFLGVGMAFTQSSIGTSKGILHKKNYKQLVYEYGIGTDVNLSKKIKASLEGQYFHLGKYKVLSNKQIKLNGFLVSGGLKIIL